MSNRKAAAKGDKLFGAVLNVAAIELGTTTLPSFIAIQEIGSRNGRKLLTHCSGQYEGVVKPISYDYGVLMWRKDRWALRDRHKDVHVSEMGHYLAVKLYDNSTDETVYVIGTHQVKEGRSFETHRTLNRHIQDSHRKETAENIIAAGDYNWKAGNMSQYYPECKCAFETDVVKSSRSGCVDNVITPKATAKFAHKEVLTNVCAFSHSPVVALYVAKRELI